MVTRTPMCSWRLPTHTCSRFTLTSVPTGASGPPGASGSTVESCTRNILRSGKTGISSRTSLRLTCHPSAHDVRLWPLACSVTKPHRSAMSDKVACDCPCRDDCGHRAYMEGIIVPDDRAGIRHRQLDARGLRMHIAEAGTGPLVLLLHGFPECWYSWRHQLSALAAAGFHAVAPDQRGYCRTDRPAAVGAYSILHLTGDVIALMDALGEESAVVAGHDWGSPVAWHAALMRPDRVRGVIGLSVPYRPRGNTPPLAVMRSLLGEGFYMIYFQEPGRADGELARDVPATFRRDR